MHPVYLDYNATTPVDPGVLKAMLPYLREEFGNPSSAHAIGQRAQKAIENARSEVAALIGAQPDEIVCRGGGTEARNMGIRGAAAMKSGRKAVVTTNIEHPATEACCVFLERDGTGPRGRVPRARAQKVGVRWRPSNRGAKLPHRPAFISSSSRPSP